MTRCSRHSHNETRGWFWLHLEMSGNLSFRDEKAAVGDTHVSSTEINEGGHFNLIENSGEETGLG